MRPARSRLFSFLQSARTKTAGRAAVRLPGLRLLDNVRITRREVARTPIDGRY
jgi:hypothetical protein